MRGLFFILFFLFYCNIITAQNNTEYYNLIKLANTYYNAGEYEKGISISEKAVAVARKQLGENHPVFAVAVNDLGLFYKEMGQYQKADSLLRVGMKIREAVLGKNHPDFGASLNNLGNLYRRMNQYEKAEPLLIEAIRIKKNVLGEYHSSYLRSLGNLAELYSVIGRYEKAEPVYLSIVKIQANNLSERNPEYAESLIALAGIYDHMGQYEKAEPVAVLAMEILKAVAGEENKSYAFSLDMLANLYRSLGQYEKAEPLSVTAVEILKKQLGEKHPEYARCLHNLANVYKSLGEFKKAEQFALSAMEIRKNVLGENDPSYARSLNSLAELYALMGQYEKAEPLSETVTEIRRKVLGENHIEYGSSLYFQAELKALSGKNEEAERLYLSANKIWKKFGDTTHRNYATELNSMANLYAKMGRYNKAEPLILQTNRVVVQNLINNFYSLSENEKQNYLDNNTSLLETSNSFLYNYKKASQDAIQQIGNIQIFFKGLILSNTKNLLRSLRQGADTILKENYNQWLEYKLFLSRQYSLSFEKRSSEFKKVQAEAEILEKKLIRSSSIFRNKQDAITIRLQEVGKKLTNEQVAVEFVRFNLYNKKWTDSTMYAAYILRKNDSVPIFIPLFEEKQLQKLFDSAGTTVTAMVSKFYRGLEVKNKNTAGALGTELYKLIWQPLEPYLKGVKKVSYSPAGKLYSIAFHALPVDSATVLMDKYQLQQYTSTRQVVLREQEKQNNKPQNITLFGDAAFTLDSLQIVKGKTKTENVSTNIYTPQNRGTRGGTWSNLPGTAQEVKTIQQLFDSNKISTNSFVQTTASEENLKALSGNSPQILHIATHGFFLPEPDKKREENNFSNENTYTLADDPLLRSGLILAGGNYAWSGKTPIDGVEDGIATAYEISQLNLSNTELVVLSACETALGDVKGSEGVFGLQRAFKMAGVKKMIVSLWQVPDKETAELMTTFYNYWMKGKTINDAFTQAQADMRKKYAPFYWAAFVLVE